MSNKTNINEIIEKLQDAVSRERLNGYFGTPDSTEKIELFETAFGVRLPNSFKTFHRNFDGGFIADDEADNMILTGEFDEAKHISTRILSINEMITEYESLSLDLLNGRKEEKENPLEIIKRCTAYLLLFPGDTITYITRANAYNDSRQYEKALADFNKSIDLVDDKNALAYYCRGNMLLSLKKARQALIDLDSACQLEPGDPLYLTGRADAFYDL